MWREQDRQQEFLALRGLKSWWLLSCSLWATRCYPRTQTTSSLFFYLYQNSGLNFGLYSNKKERGRKEGQKILRREFCTSDSDVRILTPSVSECDHIWKHLSSKVKIRSLGRAQIQSHGRLCRRKLGHRHTQRDSRVRTKQEKQPILTLILDFWPPGLWKTEFCVHGALP